MKRTVVIEWRGGIFTEMTILNEPRSNDIIFEMVDSGVTAYAKKYDVPIERIEVNIFVKHKKS